MVAISTAVAFLPVILRRPIMMPAISKTAIIPRLVGSAAPPQLPPKVAKIALSVPV